MFPDKLGGMDYFGCDRFPAWIAEKFRDQFSWARGGVLAL